MSKLLTITIPSYNVEDFLANALDHLVTVRNLKFLDIIVVDDESSDDTRVIAQQYVNKYPNSIRLITKKNGGHGSTINTGIKNAKGKYFKVVDGDDWLDSKNLDDFIRILENESADLLFNPYWKYDNASGKRKLKTVRPADIGDRENIDISRGILKHTPTMHAYTIKTSLLKSHSNIHMDENMFYVDAEYIVYPIPYAKDFKFIDLPLYMYRVDRAEQSTSLISFKKNIKMHEHVVSQISKYIDETVSDSSKEQLIIMKNRLSQLVGAQLKILCLFPTSRKTRNSLRAYYDMAKHDYNFDVASINFPIRMLIKTDFTIYPIIRMLTLFKAKYLRY